MKNEYEEVLDFIKQNKMQDSLLQIKNCRSVNKVSMAFLNLIENRRNFKDFLFEYSSEKIYFTFITIEPNPNFCKEIPIPNRTTFIGNLFTKQQAPYFNFDYNKHLIYLNICHKERPDSEVTLFARIPLSRDSTVISHSTKENIEYYKEIKNVITKDSSSMNIESFMSLVDNFFVIEIERKKPEWDITIKEDGITSVLYMLTTDKEKMIELYTSIKYSIYYIKQSLENYVSKYLYDIIYDFTHLPNEHLMKFLENFGIIHTKNDTQKIIFPLKQKVKSLRNLSFESKIDYLNRQIPNLKKNKNIGSVPYYKFVRLLNKYDYFHIEKDLKIKQSYLKKKKKFSFLNSSCIVDELNDQISKERKINLNKALSDLMTKINEILRLHTKISTPEVLDKFFLTCLNKYLLQHISYKGFINIDIVLNEDSMIDLHCFKKKRWNNSCNECCFKFLSKCLNFCNLFFDFNEGFFHKHFNVLDFSYNFNEKNIVHTFPSCFDSSKKNKIRIFDIPFKENWTSMIGNLILLIWKDQNGLGVYSDIDRVLSESKKLVQKSHDKFMHFFASTVDIICKELFELYEEAFPDFYLFCNRISKFPMNKYNCIDNLCQHFTNASMNTLLKNNIIFFHPFDLVYNIDRDSLQNDGVLYKPNLNVIIEPYLIYIDKDLFDYLEVKENKEKYLHNKDITIDSYLKEVKAINSDKINYNLILGTQKSFDTLITIDHELEVTVEKGNDMTLLESQTFFSRIEKESYNFSFLLNLSYFFTYKLTMEVKDKVIDYYILKRYINSIETSQSLSFDGNEETVIQSTSRNKAAVKTQCKKAKAILLKNLETMYKVVSYNENMLFVFYNYMKSVILKIKEKKNIHDETNMKNTFMKVGYFLVNLKTIRDVNSVEDFLNSEYYYCFNNF